MKRTGGIIVLLLVVAGLIVFFYSRKTVMPAGSLVPVSSTANSITNSAVTSTASSSPIKASLIPATPPVAPIPENLAAKAGQVIADTNTDTDQSPEAVLRNVRRAVHQYGNMFGGNPVGINSEITAALAGQNPRHINFIDASAGMRINAAGELVDAWGTPYFFHQLSATDIEIHSAGPDLKMWTSDDLMVK